MPESNPINLGPSGSNLGPSGPVNSERAGVEREEVTSAVTKAISLIGMNVLTPKIIKKESLTTEIKSETAQQLENTALKLGSGQILDILESSPIKSKVQPMKVQRMKEMLQNVKNYITKVKVFDSYTVVTLEDNTHKFKIIRPKDEPDTTFLVVSRRMLAGAIKEGKFKIVLPAVTISREEAEKAVIIKQKINLERIAQSKDKSITATEEVLSLERERYAYEILAKIPGTPETHSVSIYTEYTKKGKEVKQVIVQKEYEMELSEAIKLNVLDTPKKKLDYTCKILDTLKRFHAKGLSHGDIREGNMMYEEGNPILIDFGSTTHKDDNRPLPAGTFAYNPPESFPKGKIKSLLIEECDEYIAEGVDFVKEKARIEAMEDNQLSVKEFQEISHKCNTLFKLSDEYDKLTDALSELKWERTKLKEEINQLKEKDTDLKGQKITKMEQVKEEIRTIKERINEIFPESEEENRGEYAKLGDTISQFCKKIGFDITLSGKSSNISDLQVYLLYKIEESYTPRDPSKLQHKERQQHDCYALGMTINILHDFDPPEKLTPIINGLTHEDPEQRWTVEKALEEMKKDFPEAEGWPIPKSKI